MPLKQLDPLEKQGLFVGLIPDGNRRAVDNNPDQYLQAYSKGADVVGDALKWCVHDERVRIFAAWGLSDDNVRNRSGLEQEILSAVFTRYLDSLRKDLAEAPYDVVRVVHMGDSSLLHEEVVERLHDITHFSRQRTEKIFALCLGYGSRDELLRATALLSEDVRLDMATEDVYEYLDLPSRTDLSFLPHCELDLLIRTGAEHEYTSGFLSNYEGPGTQLHFMNTLLPNCDGAQLMQSALEDYEKRTQRKGA